MKKENIIRLTVFCILNFSLLLKGQILPSLEWVNSIGGTGNDFGQSVTTDALGNVFTTGYFQGTVDFDSGSGSFPLTSFGGYDIFIMQHDALGNFISAKQMGGTGNDFGQSIAIDATGNVYLTGYFSGICDFNPDAGIVNLSATPGGNDIFIAKYNFTSGFQWARQMGGPGIIDVGRSIDIDALGDVYVTGYFEGVANFDPTSSAFSMTSFGGTDIFITKWNTSGNFQWAKQMGGASPDYGYAVDLDASGNIFVTGGFQGTSNFDPLSSSFSLTSLGLQDIFICKLNSLGTFQWVKQMGGSANDYSYSIFIDILGNIYTTGNFLSTADFDPDPINIMSLTSSGLADIFISKLDAGGNYQWVKQVGGVGNESGYSVYVSPSGGVYTTGFFNGVVDFNPDAAVSNTLSSAGSNDVFIAKLDAVGNYEWTFNMGGTGSDIGNAITLDNCNHIYTTGYFNLVADFDPQLGIKNITSNGNADIFIHKMSIIPSVTVTASPICVPNSATLSAEGGPTPTSYTWNASTGEVITNTNIAVVSPTISTTYTLVAGIGTCTASAIATVSVYPIIPLVVTPSYTTICSGSQGVNILASGASSYTWEPSLGLSSTSGNTVNANPINTTIYTVTASDGNCSTSTTININYEAIIPISITPSRTLICNGEQVDLLAMGGTTFTWTASDGISLPNNYSVTVTPSITTSYTVTNGNVCNSSAVVTVSVVPTISLTTTPSYTTLCSNGTGVNIKGFGANTYTWSPATGLSGIIGNTVHANPVSNTVYTLTGSNGVCSTSTIVTVDVININTDAISSATVYCLGISPVTFTASGATTYSWLPSSGLSSTTGSIVTATPSVTTIYAVIGTSGNCSSVKTLTVFVPSKNYINTTTSHTLICPNGDGAILSAGGANTYTWLPGAIASTTINANPPSTTAYTVIGQASNGCFAVPAVVSISVAPALNSTLTAFSPTVCYENSVAILESLTGPNLSYVWLPFTEIAGPNNTNSIIAKPTNSTNTTYSVYISDGTCTTTNTIEIEVFICVPPVSDFVAITEDSICNMGCITFSATSTGGSPMTYSWSFPGGTPSSSNIQNPEICYMISGQYPVTLVSTDPFSSTTITKNDFVTVLDKPIVKAFGDATINVGQSAPIFAIGASHYEWYIQDGSISCVSCANTIVQPTITTQYIVSGYNTKFCKEQDTVLITVDFVCSDLFVPNVFSPNGDGLNDVMHVRGFCISTLNFQVFSRWGEKVFETSEVGEGWDGTYNGQSLDTGIFVYKAVGTTVDKKPFSIKGNITLLR